MVIGYLVVILFVGIGVGLFVRQISLIKNCVAEASGTVIDVHREIHRDSHGSHGHWYSSVQYTVKGLNYILEFDGHRPIGYVMDVMYDPNNPHRSYAKSQKVGGFAFPAIWTGVCLMFLIILISASFQ